MGAIVAFLGRMLLSVAGSWLISALVGAGIGLATHSAGNALGVGNNIRAMMGQAGVMYNYIGFFGLDTAITIVLSAWAGRAITDAAKAYFVANNSPKPKA